MAIPKEKPEGCNYPNCGCTGIDACEGKWMYDPNDPWATRKIPTKPQREGDQPMPVRNQHPAVWPIVMRDMMDRHELGVKRYGTPLQPHNGRDALRDAYEEALDLAVYLRAAIYERDGK